MDWLAEGGTRWLLLAAAGGAAAVVCAAAGWYARGVRPRSLAQSGSVADILPAAEGRPAAPAPPAAPAVAPARISVRELLAAAIEQADELVSITVPSGEMVHANGAFCRALGYEIDDIPRMRVSDCLGEQSRAPFEEVEAAVRADGAWRGTLVRRRRDESTFLVSCSVMPLAGPSGEVSYFVSLERDITHEMHLREQLIHSERLAAVGQLVSGVAHELNNPLQSIIGFTELLIEAERRKESRADLEQVRSEAHRAAKIVRNLLAFVRRSAVERGPASLNEIVQATVALRKYEFSMSGVALDEDYGVDLPMVIVNREEIQQVLLNLLLNAEQAMRSAGVEGHLWLRTARSADRVSVEIRDAGPGVPPTLARRIFEPFYSTKGVGEGTGLGLSIAIGIAEAHGGTLTLVPGNGGACFRLSLPPAAVSVGETVETVPPVEPWTAISGRCALVADDEGPLRKLLQRLLTRRGFAVDTAEDGLQASGMIERTRYDVILCDVQMPRMTGMQLYESIRRRQPHLAAAFVLISGDILNGPLQTFVETHQIPLLSKPFGAKTLDVALDQVLAHRVQARDVAEARAS